MMRFLILCLLSLPVLADSAITLEYRDKPPYSFTSHGRPSGFLLARMAEVFRRANIPVIFAEMPAKRISADIKANAAPICSPGWYKLAERERFARFSLPILQDRPQVVLAGAQMAAAVRRKGSIRALFADPAFTMGVVDGVSYGAEIDGWIARLPNPPVRAIVVPLQMARMVANQRADFMIIDEDDLSAIVQSHEYESLGLQRIVFPDPPHGLKRYLMCSQSVPQNQMDRINLAIQSVVGNL
jgi:polar amino acid transport system substrate-binding protein